MTYGLGDTFCIPGFPKDTVLVVGGLVRVGNTTDVAMVAIHGVPGLGENGGPAGFGFLPISVEALDASSLVPAGERAELPDDFLAGIGSWLSSDESRGSTFTAPVADLLNMLTAQLRLQ